MTAAEAPRYIGRFAPSPTGPLHAGSLVAALASWLDARAFDQQGCGGLWLVRMEDVDAPRCITGADQLILRQLARCGLVPDAVPLWQSTRTVAYQRALDQLIAQGDAYPCSCSRKDIEDAHDALGHARERHAALPYPGTCRDGLRGRQARSWRFNTTHFMQKVVPALATQSISATYSIAQSTVHWTDRRLGQQQQDVAATVGDFVLRRADGLWAYQLAVVVDDAAQAITHVVRGEDLADNTPRQILLQRALGLSTPHYLHNPLVWGLDGEKLSKQNGAQALDLQNPIHALNRAVYVLGLAPAQESESDLPRVLAAWVTQWSQTYNGAP